MAIEPTEKSERLQRQDFTAEQVVAADYSGFIADVERVRRTKSHTYSIDDLSSRDDTIPDRDDGILVEAKPRGDGYRVHVTIADVAAHVPLGSALAGVAHDRAFTVYRPWMEDHMFPESMVERMSLEHEKERLGLAIEVDLDRNFQPVHTRFNRVLTKPRNLNYTSATQAMKENPEMQQMVQIAQGLRSNFLNAGQPRQLARSANAHSHQPMMMKPSRAVETYMKLANLVTAEFFAQTELPFMYRNFNKQPNMGEESVAYYSTECVGHKDFKRGNASRSYGYVTSPIRRGADFYNQHMMHHTIDVLQEAEAGLRAIAPAVNQQKLSDALWDGAPKILDQTRVADGARRVMKEAALKTIFSEVMEQVGAPISRMQQNELKSLCHDIAKITPPISHDDLQAHANQMNRLHGREVDISKQRHVRQAILREEYQTAWVNELDELSGGALQKMDADKFSTILFRAATVGHLPELVMTEAIHRMKQGNGQFVGDAVQVLVAADYPNSEPWNKLKRATIKAIKHRSDMVPAVLQYAVQEGYLPEEAGEVSSVILPEYVDGNIKDNHQFVASYIAIPTDDAMIAAPYYSVGQDERSAKSHAQYSFLEHLAFGQLRPVQQAALPNLLYASLDTPDSDREVLVEGMIKKLGATMRITARYNKADDVPASVVRVSGGEVREEVWAYAEGATAEDAKELALKRLLRKPEFKRAASMLNAMEMHQMDKPMEDLERFVTGRGWQMTTDTEEKKDGRKHGFLATITLTDETGKTIIYRHMGPNKHRALNSAGVDALKAQGVTDVSHPMQAGSWAEDTLRRHEKKPKNGVDPSNR